MIAKALLAALTAALADHAHAGDSFPAAFEARLAAADPVDAQAGFALGAAQFLGAVEGLSQDLWRHGLTQPTGRNLLTDRETPIGVTMLPLLRFPVPVNPAPQPFTAEVLHAMLAGFDGRLAQSATTLAAVPRSGIRLPLDISAIRLDMNADGVAQDKERLAAILARVACLGDSTPLPPVKLDSGDLPWLKGYAHLLQGITGILRAHDLTQTVNRTLAAAFPDSPLPSAPLISAQKAQADRVKAMWDAGKCDDDNVAPLRHDEDFRPRDPVTLTPEERQAVRDYEDCSSLADVASDGGIGDLVAFVHLLHWPVTDADRLRASASIS